MLALLASVGLLWGAPSSAADDGEEAATAQAPFVDAGRVLNDDFWDTGTFGHLDEHGRLVYVVKTELVPLSALGPNRRPDWIDPYTLSPGGYYVSDPRLLRSRHGTQAGKT